MLGLYQLGELSENYLKIREIKLAFKIKHRKAIMVEI